MLGKLPVFREELAILRATARAAEPSGRRPADWHLLMQTRSAQIYDDDGEMIIISRSKMRIRIRVRVQMRNQSPARIDAAICL